MLSEPTEAHMQIMAVIQRIPRGCVSTYGHVATMAGLPGRARLVGTVLRSSPLAEDLPWHRVVNAGGRLSTVGQAARLQRQRLIADGVEVDERGRIDLSTRLWTPSGDQRQAGRKRKLILKTRSSST
jgi:methylated-DNA-protein-cysteine methyltransferase-like protein